MVDSNEDSRAQSHESSEGILQQEQFGQEADVL